MSSGMASGLIMILFNSVLGLVALRSGARKHLKTGELYNLSWSSITGLLSIILFAAVCGLVGVLAAMFIDFAKSRSKRLTQRFIRWVLE